MNPWLALLAAVALFTMPAAAESVRAVDGDTIVLDGTTYRLWGVDAAETRQKCADGWPAGAMAFCALFDLMAGRGVTCEPRTRDRDGRVVALCRADGLDLGAAMVGAGMAWAFTRYSLDYAAESRVAIDDAAGVHGHDCVKPWAWRALDGARPPVSETPPR